MNNLKKPEYCPSCQHFTVVQGHCNFCGHRMEVIPWRNVWEIVEKFKPGINRYSTLPFWIKRSQVLQRELKRRGDWLMNEITLRSSAQNTMRSAYLLELKQISHWFGTHGNWRKYADLLYQEGILTKKWKSLNAQIKNNKIIFLAIIVGALFIAPFGAHILFRLLLLFLN